MIDMIKRLKKEYFHRFLVVDEEGDEIARIRVKIFKERGRLTNYVVQLEYKLGKIFKPWKPVVRYNYCHNFVHKDTFNTKGRKIKREYFGKYKDLKDAAKMAEHDLKLNFQHYIKWFVKRSE